MLLSELVTLRGVTAYVEATAEQPWLHLRFADGCWIRIAAVDVDGSHYLIEPVGRAALDGGLASQFLAIWAAWMYVGGAALASVERAIEIGGLLGEPRLELPYAGAQMVVVEQPSNGRIGLKLLERVVTSSGRRSAGTLSFAGSL